MTTNHKIKPRSIIVTSVIASTINHRGIPVTLTESFPLPDAPCATRENTFSPGFETWISFMPLTPKSPDQSPIAATESAFSDSHCNSTLLPTRTIDLLVDILTCGIAVGLTLISSLSSLSSPPILTCGSITQGRAPTTSVPSSATSIGSKSSIQTAYSEGIASNKSPPSRTTLSGTSASASDPHPSEVRNGGSFGRRI